MISALNVSTQYHERMIYVYESFLLLSLYFPMLYMLFVSPSLFFYLHGIISLFIYILLFHSPFFYMEFHEEKRYKKNYQKLRQLLIERLPVHTVCKTENWIFEMTLTHDVNIFVVFLFRLLLQSCFGCLEM